MDIPFDRSLPAAPGAITTIVPGIRRVIAPNPGPFTFTGTCSYLVGTDEIAIIDPGPDDEGHVEALVAAIGGARLAAILVTHTHADHSPGARRLKARTGAPIVGAGPHWPARALHAAEANPLDASTDADHAPDRVLADGEALQVGGHRLTALATPGHTMNHLAFALDDGDFVFSGDHVMAWSTTIVAPPDGAMRPYLASLGKLQEMKAQLFLPGHGAPVAEPARFVRALIGHRRMREGQIVAALGAGPVTISALVATMYAGLDPNLQGAAALSVLAQIEMLVEDGRVLADPAPTLSAHYRLAGEATAERAGRSRREDRQP